MICVEAVLLVCMLVVYSINFEELNTWSCNVLELLLLSFIALCFCYIDSSRSQELAWSFLWLPLHSQLISKHKIVYIHKKHHKNTLKTKQYNKENWIVSVQPTLRCIADTD